MESDQDLNLFTALREAIMALGSAGDVDELDHPISLEEAEQVEIEVNIGQKKLLRTLRWMVNNRPLAMESMMDTTPPGTAFFWCVMLVYNANVAKIQESVDVQYAKVRRGALRGLERRRLSLLGLDFNEDDLPVRVKLNREARALAGPEENTLDSAGDDPIPVRPIGGVYSNTPSYTVAAYG